jgi:hypothetical protein
VIALSDLAAKAIDLTADAVKLAVQLSALDDSWFDDDGWLTLDLAGARRLAKILKSSEVVIRKCAIELADIGLLERKGRSFFHAAPNSLSDHPASVARSPAPGVQTVLPHHLVQPTIADGGQQKPTIHRNRERSERKGRAGVAGEERGDGGLNGELCPQSEPGAHTLVMAAYDALFRESNDGAAPTFGPRVGALVKALLKSHSADEIVRRMTIMFREGRRFPAPPYDMGTLSSHFDKFASSVGPKNERAVDRNSAKLGAGYYGEVDE